MEKNTQTNLIIKELKDRYNFEVKQEYQESLLNGLEYMKGLKVEGDKIIVEEHLDGTKEKVLAEVVDEGKCVGCAMPEFIIQHEINAGEMTEHLMCEGCGKTCDGGDEEKDNKYTFNSHNHGAGVHYRGNKSEEGYCKECKFKMLCGDCGYPKLDFEDGLCHKPKGEDFYICVDCAINREEEEHKENHLEKGQLDPNCFLCQELVDEYLEKEKNNKKSINIEE